MGAKFAILVVIFLLSFQILVHPVPSNRSTYQVKKATGPVKIDGRIDEKTWEDALVLKIDNEILPSENIEALTYTECRIMYDRKNLYVAFRAHDPHPEQIRAKLADRDSAWDDDVVAIILDTFNDENRAYAFFCNPYGVQMDEILSNGGTQEDSSWDAIWNSAGRITDEGYEVEIAIPFHALQFPRKKGIQTWGFSPLRIYPRSRRHQFTNFLHNRSESCILCQFHKLTGIENASPGRNIELDPTLTAFQTDEREEFPEGPLKKADSNLEAGLSGHWGITSNLTLSGTVNPDFSQVEADAVQLDINTQFALFYPEKRPFFLEGIDFFQTPINAVHTRTVVDPNWGVKLTGKEGKNAVGLFICRDDVTNLLIPDTYYSSSFTVDIPTTTSVMRYRRDLSNSSTLGVLITDREGENYFNRVVGADGLLRLSKSDIIQFQVLGSNTRYPLDIATGYFQDTGTFAGYAANLSYSHSERAFSYYVDYKDNSGGFRADLGFIPQVNFRRGELGARYIYWGKKSDFFSKILLGGNVDLTVNHDGDLLERELEASLSLKMPMQSSFTLSGGMRKKYFLDVPFDQEFMQVSFHVRPSGKLFFNCFIIITDDIDYDHVRPGEYFQVEPSISFIPGKNLESGLTYSYHRLDIEEGKLFDVHIIQGHLIYHFNKRTFLRGVLQYTNLKVDTNLYHAYPVDSQEKRLYSQFLFSYKINPRTVLFLGYSDKTFGLPGTRMTQLNRTFFLKIGYALSL